MDLPGGNYPPPLPSTQTQPYYTQGANGYDILQERDDAPTIAELRSRIEEDLGNSDGEDDPADSDVEDTHQWQRGPAIYSQPGQAGYVETDGRNGFAAGGYLSRQDEDSDGDEDEQDEMHQERLRRMLAEMDAEDNGTAPAAIRGEERGRGRGRNRGRGGWRAVLRSQGLGNFFAKPARAPRGEGRRGGVTKGTRMGPRAPAEPSQEFKDLQGQAMGAYLSDELETAERLVRQAIEINPEIFASHSLLSEIYHRMGKHGEADTVLWVGSYTRNDPKIWWEIAKRINENPSANPEDKQNRLLECYSRIIKLDKGDHLARNEKLSILAKQNQHSKAIQSCRTMLKRRPFDLDTLRVYVDQCLKGDKTDDAWNTRKARDAYLKALEHFRRLYPDGVGLAVEAPATEETSNEFIMPDMNILLETFLKAKDWINGIRVLKSGCRWLRGRADEKYWDEWTEDDREWDIEDEPRRSQVPQFQSGVNGDISSYGEGLPLEIRAKLGIFRLHLGADSFEEALSHFDHFKQQDDFDDELVQEYFDEVIAIASALHDTSHHDLAYEWFKAAQNLWDISELHKHFPHEANIAAARTCVHVNQSKDALPYYSAAIAQEPGRHFLKTEYQKTRQQVDPQQRVLPDTDDSNLLTQDGVNMNIGSPVKGLTGVLQVQHSQTLDGLAVDGSTQALSMTELRDHQRFMETFPGWEKTRTKNRGKPKNLFRKTNLTPENIADYYALLQENAEDMREAVPQAVEEWIDAASQLISAFCSIPGIYSLTFQQETSTTDDPGNTMSPPSTANQPRGRAQSNFDEGDSPMPSRRQEELPKDKVFGINCEEWLDIFNEYALVTAREGDSLTAYESLQTTKNIPYLATIPDFVYRHNIVDMGCAILLEDEERLIKVSRSIMNEYPAATDGFRMYTLLSRLHHSEARLFSDDTNQKFIMRKIKMVDFFLLPEEARKFWGFSEVERRYQARIEDAIMKGPTKSCKPGFNNPVVMALYGHVLLASGSSKNAIQYLMRAYAMRPDDPMVCIALATAYIVHAMKRQSTNRHYYILMSLSFLQKYRHSRLADACRYHRPTRREYAVLCEEVEFNEGRLWQLLGLPTEALAPFERCLNMPEEVDVPDFIVDSSLIDSPGINSHEENNLNQHEDVEMLDEGKRMPPTGFKREAAYSLQTMYLLSGNMEAAREVAQQWLVFE